jgi:glycosyltransferase involved in cell wall biosynthesis
MTARYRVAVVVATYQRAERLPSLIAALEAQTFPRDDFEVVVCDDGSVDDTPAVLRRLSAETSLNLRVMTTDRNRGPAAARNLAWRSTSAPVLAFVDDDCTPTPAWLEAGLANFDGEVAIVQGRTIPDPSTPLGRWPVTQRLERFTNRYEACNIFWRTDVLRTVGGFDESIYFFGEDTVPGWHARRLGVGERFAPDALVHHAVTHRDWRWHVRYALQHGHWPMLIRRFPEMRREVLWHGLFLKPRHAGVWGAFAGIALGAFWRPGFALVIPYAWYARPRSLQLDRIVDALGGAGFDALVVAGLAAGSLRQRTPVL